MREYRHRWEEYKRVLEKRAIAHPIQWVACTTAFAFVAGLNTTLALFGRYFLPHFNVAVAIYVVSTTYVCVALFDLTLVRVLRQQKNLADAQNKAK
jgi:hypothetical protein